MSEQSSILVVEDDEALSEMVADHLESTVGANICRVSGAEDALCAEADDPPDLLLTDLLLPDGDGLELVRAIRRRRRDYPVLIMTGRATLGRAVEAMRLGVSDLFAKPFDLNRLTRVVKQSLAKYDSLKRSRQRCERLRRITRSVIDERKELQQRVDLVCRDLVDSYRDLTQRFVRYRNDESGGID